MTENRLLIEELSAKSGDADFLRLIAENVLQLIMEADVDGLIGAGRRDCQDFRVWPGIMGNKESHYVTTQRTCHTE
ncbi:mobile element protein [Sphingobium fuliginis]|uniref:Mobile element protein n=1 Tax=Sphingobium fuliginis (strain ATCC 27551) TaxID=336203 RepID=A0A292ZAD6_SPHSA|nr:mobile element protein [Sphingobium fuliginis]